MDLFELRRPILRIVRQGREALARRRLRANSALWRLVGDYAAQTQSTGCQAIDYDALYRHVRETRPRHVLECGTGTSTVVIAQALRENEAEDGVAGLVTSMEEHAEWFDLAAKLVPPELQRFIDIRLSSTVDDGYLLFRGVRYVEVPERPYDFVFVDGPSSRSPSDGTRSFCFDLLHVVRGSERPVTGIVDTRLTTGYVLQQVFGRDKYRYDPYAKLGRLAPVTRHDMRTVGFSSRAGTTHSLRLLAPTRLQLRLEAPEKVRRKSKRRRPRPPASL